MISKMKPAEGRRHPAGDRLQRLARSSPASAGSGESNIRQWIIENDWLEAIVALPDQLFYNTGISTYIWIVTNRKEEAPTGKIQLIDATGYFVKMRKSLGNKRNEIGDGKERQARPHRRDYPPLRRVQEGEHVKIFDNEDFGYQRITVERPLRLNFAVTEERLAKAERGRPVSSTWLRARSVRTRRVLRQRSLKAKHSQEAILQALQTLKPQGIVKNREEFSEAAERRVQESRDLHYRRALFKAILMALSERDETADICTDSKGNPEPDPELRDYENVPLKEDIQEYMAREVLPHVPDAWVDESKTKIGL